MASPSFYFLFFVFLTIIASSSHAVAPQIKYDVFINFRGNDTRKGFTSHLHAALKRNGIDAFMDERFEGEEISETLSRKISESQVSVVIFSINYADSRLCLDELVKIIECRKENRQAVLPVFLGVEPTHVRHQSDAFGDAFSRVIKDEQYKGKEKIWRRALVNTASLSGWDSNHMSESEIIDRLLKRIQNILGKTSSNDSDNNFVRSGRVEEGELLSTSTEVHYWGIGCSSITAPARKVFDHFFGFFFLFNFLKPTKTKDCDCRFPPVAGRSINHYFKAFLGHLYPGSYVLRIKIEKK